MSARLPCLDIGYRVGTGGQLPAPGPASGLASCCDVLEHVSGLDRVVTETARVPKPGGPYPSGTINRTRKSKPLAIKVMQQWLMTRLTGAAIHDWDMFTKPAEAADVLERHGLQPGAMADLGPRAKLPVVPGSPFTARRGESPAGGTQPTAGRRRLARRLRATPGTAPSRQRLRGALGAAARLRPAPRT